jgi:hypothetical protein
MPRSVESRGLGGILMGWISGRVGVRRVVIGCGAMLAAGLIVASFGGLWSLYLCNLLLVGLLGAAGMFSDDGLRDALVR